jgi:hypothetical protein
MHVAFHHAHKQINDFEVLRRCPCASKDAPWQGNAQEQPRAGNTCRQDPEQQPTLHIVFYFRALDFRNVVIQGSGKHCGHQQWVAECIHTFYKLAEAFAGCRPNELAPRRLAEMLVPSIAAPLQFTRARDDD